MKKRRNKPMRGIVLWYSKNRKKIWRNIGIVVIIIIVIQFMQELFSKFGDYVR